MLIDTERQKLDELTSQALINDFILIISMVLLFCAGWLITWKIEFVTGVTGVAKNFWFVHESLSGFFAHFVNELLAKWMNVFLADSSWGVFLACTLVTLVSMMICIPGVLLLNKFIPQLVGKPKIKGPILGNLI